MSRIAVYDRYWRTLGGGEQFAGGIAEILAADHDVDVLGPEAPNLEALKERLGVDLSRCNYRQITDEQSVSEASKEYDLFINCTYLSFAPCQAKAGLYVAHFPAPPDPAAAKLRQRRAVIAKGLGLLPQVVLPNRAQQARINWAGDALPTAPGLSTYTTVVANSTYTQHWLDRLWGVQAEVLYPPVHVPSPSSVAPLADREPIILTIGRFVDPTLGHCKKQAELIEAFALLNRQEVASGWTLHIVGGCEPANRNYLQKVRKAAAGLPVHIHLNATGEVRDDLLARASIYWHGAGLGEDPELHPDRYEHFGISVVEAMGHGLVPVVLNAAGPAEIVRDTKDGHHVHDIAGFASQTAQLIRNETERLTLAASSIDRSQNFAMPAFTNRLHSVVTPLLRP
jgi:glycosyltransferase involved in cell wall biosynthesis